MRRFEELEFPFCVLRTHGALGHCGVQECDPKRWRRVMPLSSNGWKQLASAGEQSQTSANLAARCAVHAILSRAGGGATRLTESGLSITEWKPIHGAIPPLSVAEWEEEFQLYKRIPQYQEINRGMSLDEFKTIFWWEWAHRLLARTIGLIFALPLAYFWLTGRIEKRLRLPLLGLLALGGFQGFVGWWMVSSGLVNRTDVSQYRLATHLTIACLIFAGCMWILRGCRAIQRMHRMSARAGVCSAACGPLSLSDLSRCAGAGLNAGLSYNTWPLMDGSIVPGDLFHPAALVDQSVRKPEDCTVHSSPSAHTPCSPQRSGTW